jgi:solute carrier family 25, member 39/40
LRDVPFSGVYWYLYEKNKREFKKNFGSIQPFVLNFASGASAGIVASVLTNPIDVIKTRIVKRIILISKAS